MKWILPLILFSAQAFTSIDKAPKPFKTKLGLAIFADFKTIESHITYDHTNEEAIAESTVILETNKAGHIIFDLVPDILEARLNERQVKIIEVSAPNQETKYRIINFPTTPGIHKLFIKNKVNKNVSYSSWFGTHVRSAFWMTDLQDRSYLERYIPSNLEYDQFQLTLNVEVKGENLEDHKIYTNGNVRTLAKNKFEVIFPEYYTASSFYYHLAPKDKFNEKTYTFQSISGRNFQVEVYSSNFMNVDNAIVDSKKVLKELEQKLGAWPHEKLTIYVAGSGGMEHSGATITSLRALGHELIHSYFARGVMPIDGNAGWMDEAIASWRDGGYKTVSRPNFSSTRMSAHSTYKRSTDRKAYTQGANFMAFLNYELTNQGGLISFLKELHKRYGKNNISTKIFIKELKNFSGRDFYPEFKKYIFGKKINSKSHVHEINPYHHLLTEQQEKDLL